MPYKNMPESMWAKMDKCVSDVQAKGHDKQGAIAICYTSLMKGKELGATMKSFKLKAAPNYRITAKASDKSGDYLIVEDKTKPTTWHLQVRQNGKPDHTLMGAAWAALHNGYRGNKYEGPNKGKAIAELKKLYEDESMAVPTEKSIMDAPNLRGDDERNCWNCQYFQSLPDTQMSKNLNDMQAMRTAPSDMVDIASGSGICTQYDFEADSEWVCDGWAPMQPQMATANPDEMMVSKEANGHYRWIAFTSSSYQDNDKEIVSQKALEQDADRMSATGEYGTLDWWHTPIILGDCDTSFMHGHISIESGTFRDDRIGELFATMKGLGMSRTFFNPINEPDAQGVYHNIRTFSRAILPADRASNRLTLLDVSAKENKMSVVDKAKGLVTKLIQGGASETEAQAKVDQLLKTAEVVDLAAKEANIQQKETAPVAPEAAPEVKAAEPKAWFVGDMTPEEFDSRLEQAVVKFMTPAIKEIGAQVAKMSEAQAITAKETGEHVTASIKSVQDMQTDLAARLAALEGLTPSGYRPTADPLTKVDPATAKEKAPKGDAKADASLSAWLTQT